MKTLYDKLWEEHHVSQLDSGESLLYIDRHYLHEVTSPQAFEGLSKKNLKPWRLGANIATPDHNVPTERGSDFGFNEIEDEISKIQVIELDKNCNKETFEIESLLEEDLQDLKELITNHFNNTGSVVAEKIIESWDIEVERFIKVMPTDYKRVLNEMKLRKESNG